MMGSLVNAITSGAGQKEPEVGMGATVCMWSDRNPYTIVEVLRFKSGERKGQVSGVKVRADKSRVVRGSEADGSAVYEFERGPQEWPTATFVKDARGRYVKKGTAGKGDRLSIGQRDAYRDPSF